MDTLLLQPGDASFFQGLPECGVVPPADAASPELCLPLLSLAQDMRQPPITAPGGQPAGPPFLNGIGATRHADALSVILYDHCLRGVPLGVGVEQPTMLYVGEQVGGGIGILLTLALRDARMGEIQFQAQPGSPPVETFTLSFSEILWTYVARKPDGSPLGKTFGGWSLIHNRPIASFTD